MDSNISQLYILVTLHQCNFDALAPLDIWDASAKVQPQHSHDCDACEFLGRNGGHDLYVCHALPLAEVIVRFGSEQQEYSAVFLKMLELKMKNPPVISDPVHHDPIWKSYCKIAMILNQR